MSGNYNIQLVKKVLMPKFKKERKQFSIVKRDKMMIDIEDIQTIYKQFLDKGIEAERISILGLNGERLTTIKSLESGETFDYFDDEYLNGKPEEIREKLSEFYNIQVIIY
jgi:hypothetical protein